VLEFVARVTPPGGSVAGDRVRYQVAAPLAGVPKPAPGTQNLSALTTATQSVPASVSGLLANPSSLRLLSGDVFGNVYSHSLLASSTAQKVLRYGPLHSQVRTYGVMQPVGGPTSTTLKHFFGVHAYVSVLSGEEVVLLDLRVNNGPSNASGSSLDDAVDRVYFDALDLAVPAGWVVVQAFDDPGFGTPYPVGGSDLFPLVAPIGDGTFHVMPRQGQMLRRLAIAPAAQVARAQALLAQEGLAFCVDGDGVDGPYWSWWNRDTARYFPQAFQLPSLEHLGLANVRATLAADFTALQTHMADGTGLGNYPLSSGRLGWAHPYGTAYGGMTGGDEIHLFDGVSTAAAASVEGYRRFQLLHRMHTDRQPNVLYDLDGQPADIWNWYVENGANSYVYLNWYMGFIGGNDPIGFQTVDKFQVDHAAATGKKPSYEAQLLSFEAHDLQHLVRYTRSPKVLAWLGNDTLAKDDVLMQAELARLSYHPYYNNPFGGFVTTGMRQDLLEQQANPGGGIDYGRGESWALDTVAAAYALGTPAWRDQAYPWFQTLATLLSNAQVSCSGFIQAKITSKILGGKYRGAQSYELSIMDNAIRGMQERAFRWRDPGYQTMLYYLLRDHYYAFIGPMMWNASAKGPWEMFGVGPTPATASPWCSPTQQPGDAFAPTANKYQTWSTLGYAYRETGGGGFLIKAGQMIGGDLLTQLQGAGLANLENRAALLAVVQDQAGIL
ncbi:MAG TPA: hypothetical protein VJP77_05000, partial [Planctomycetota bacterium]|nr:hypothetical protein [Planctomycetota bacterium]